MTNVPKRIGSRMVTMLAAVAVGLSLGAVPGAPAAADEAVTLPDGSSSELSAASCWEIKQSNPESPDGVYWLVTPALQAPEQFYCDMTTDGGGWVLIGRGREGWREQYEGRGTTAQVRTQVTGQEAFSPRQLSSKVIDGLLDGGRVDALTDGVRVRRATNVDGSAWQEVRFKFQKRDRWVWALGAEHRLANYSFDGVVRSGGQTNNFGADSAFRRVDFRQRSDQGWTIGWAYGSAVPGTSAADSYLWSSVDGRGYARPFAQVYLRPRLTMADLEFAPIPDGGTPKAELTELLEQGVLPGAWGVTGLGNGRSGETNVEIADFEQIGSRVFVGGNFRYVQRGANATGADRVEQRFLAAFDVVTGDWDPGFRPVLNEQVKSLAALPNGTLAVGGQFSQANGQPVTGFVAVDPQSGATVDNWALRIENRITGGTVVVRALEVQSGFLYLGEPLRT